MQWYQCSTGVLLATSAALHLLGTYTAKSQHVYTRGRFDVTRFGADPTATHESADAIQAAVFAAGNASATANGTVTYDVEFPPGHYQLNRTVVLGMSGPDNRVEHGGSGLRLIGVGGRALLHQACQACDIFHGTQVWRLEVTNLAFQGGRSHLRVGNNNTGAGWFLFHDLEFSHSADAAIRMLGPSCPEAVCPDPAGTYSSELTVRDCKFFACQQVLINWCDWSVLSDSSIVTSSAMENLAAIENHNHLMVRNVLGVPGGAPSLARWFDNYAHRVNSGTLHVSNMRFGNEHGGLLPVWNFSPYICLEVMQSHGGEMCGRVNRSGAPLPSIMRPAGGSSIILDGCLIDGFTGHAWGAAAVYMEEIPAQLVIRGCYTNALNSRSGYHLVKVVDADIALDGPYLRNTMIELAPPVFTLTSSTWGSKLSAQWDLPDPLQPYRTDRIYATAQPSSGSWPLGAVVWRREAEGSENAAATATAPILGWVCTRAGWPGSWHPFGANSPFFPFS